MRQDLMVTASMCYVGYHQTGHESHIMLESEARCSTRILRKVFLSSQQQQQHAYSAVAAELTQSRVEQSQNRAAYVKVGKLILSSRFWSCQLATSLDGRVADMHQPLIIVLEPCSDSHWHGSNMQVRN